MAIALNYRYYMILKHLYSDYETGKQYILRDKSDGNGPQLTWITKKKAAPTVTEMNNAREAATDAWWWYNLRTKRNTLLKESDWASGADVPDATKSAYATYRGKLRDLPTTVTKPAYSTLDNQTEKQMVDHMDTLMPTKPS